MSASKIQSNVFKLLIGSVQGNQMKEVELAPFLVPVLQHIFLYGHGPIQKHDGKTPTWFSLIHLLAQMPFFG